MSPKVKQKIEHDHLFWYDLFDKMWEYPMDNDELAREIGYADWKNLERSTIYRGSMSVRTFVSICNSIQRHPAEFLKYQPTPKKSS